MRSGRGRGILIRVLVVGLALLLLEGAASFLVFAWKARMTFWPPTPERSHTVYDPELGWVGAAGTTARNVYGPGLDVTTNGQGFRNRRDFGRRVPDGRIRVIALGDSFTLGHDVADDDSWPARMEAWCAGVEAPNMGQSGYGIDQSYLWYLRDGRPLDHHVLVFSIIALDIDRTRLSRMILYGKPVLRIVDGELVARNVPVPRGPYVWPVLTQNLRLLWNLRSVELVQTLVDRFGSPAPGDPWAVGESEARELATAIFEDLQRRTAANGVRMLLVHLPHLSQSDPSMLSTPPRTAMEAIRGAAELGIEVLDLTPAFEAIPDPERRSLFIEGSRLEGAGRHYSAAGNDFVARRIASALVDRSWIPASACDVEAMREAGR